MTWRVCAPHGLHGPCHCRSRLPPCLRHRHTSSSPPRARHNATAPTGLLHSREPALRVHVHISLGVISLFVGARDLRNQQAAGRRDSSHEGCDAVV